VHIAIVHDTVGQKDAPDTKDVLAQADAVAEALRHIGHTHFRAEISLDMATLVRTLSNGGADLVFNLVESIGGKGRLIHLLPYCLDAVPLPYTGAPAQAMLLTSNKIMAKKWMETSAIVTPAWIGPFPGGNGKDRFGSADKSTWIVKSVWEHASIGLGPESIVKNLTADAAYAALAGRAPALGGACFAEAFVDGREFNLSLLTAPDGPEVLPPAEIIFDGYTADMPRIVDYRAKWDEAAYEFHHTPRQFDFDTTDGDLLDTMLISSATSNGPAPRCRPVNRSTPTSFPSATRPVRPKSRRCSRATTASTPSHPSTPTPPSIYARMERWPSWMWTTTTATAARISSIAAAMC